MTALSPFLRQHFMADDSDEVPMDVVVNNYRCSMDVLENPAKFPRADVEYLTEEVTQIRLFWPTVTR